MSDSYKAVITLEIYEGDGVWHEAVADGLLTRIQIINDACVQLLSCAFAKDFEDWYERGMVYFQAVGTDDQLLAEFTVFTPEDKSVLISEATRAFHHEVVRLQEMPAQV